MHLRLNIFADLPLAIENFTLIGRKIMGLVLFFLIYTRWTHAVLLSMVNHILVIFCLTMFRKMLL